MPIYVGQNKLKDIYVGTTKIGKVYVGTTLVYNSDGTTPTPGPDPEPPTPVSDYDVWILYDCNDTDRISEGQSDIDNVTYNYLNYSTAISNNTADIMWYCDALYHDYPSEDNSVARAQLHYDNQSDLCLLLLIDGSGNDDLKYNSHISANEMFTFTNHALQFCTVPATAAYMNVTVDRSANRCDLMFGLVDKSATNNSGKVEAMNVKNNESTDENKKYSQYGQLYKFSPGANVGTYSMPLRANMKNRNDLIPVVSVIGDGDQYSHMEIRKIWFSTEKPNGAITLD